MNELNLILENKAEFSTWIILAVKAIYHMLPSVPLILPFFLLPWLNRQNNRKEVTLQESKNNLKVKELQNKNISKLISVLYQIVFKIQVFNSIVSSNDCEGECIKQELNILLVSTTELQKQLSLCLDSLDSEELNKLYEIIALIVAHYSNSYLISKDLENNNGTKSIEGVLRVFVWGSANSIVEEVLAFHKLIKIKETKESELEGFDRMYNCCGIKPSKSDRDNYNEFIKKNRSIPNMTNHKVNEVEIILLDR